MSLSVSQLYELPWPVTGIALPFMQCSLKPKLTAMGIRCTDHATPSIRESWD
jgi:hypothetical protein